MFKERWKVDPPSVEQTAAARDVLLVLELDPELKHFCQIDPKYHPLLPEVDHPGPVQLLHPIFPNHLLPFDPLTTLTVSNGNWSIRIPRWSCGRFDRWR